MPPLRCSAWLQHNIPGSLESFEAHAGALERVYPVWYYTAPGGEVLRRPDATAELRDRVRAAAKAGHVEIWPLVSNQSPLGHAFDPALMREVMVHDAIRRSHILRVLELAREDGAQGVDLDYESLPSGDRDDFTAFVRELADAAHLGGLKVGIALHAKDQEPGAWDGPKAQDYAALGELCDRVQIMGYDFHWSSSPPGPVAPPAWCAQVLAHATSLIPAEKLEWGIPGYGYHWSDAAPTRYLGWKDWVSLVTAHAPERRDPESVELSLKWGGEEVWMNDAISLTAKLWPARRAGVRQVALWVLGVEDPRWWALLDTLPEDFL